jgi:hypothetical protein
MRFGRRRHSINCWLTGFCVDACAVPRAHRSVATIRRVMTRISGKEGRIRFKRGDAGAVHYAAVKESIRAQYDKLGPRRRLRFHSTRGCNSGPRSEPRYSAGAADYGLGASFQYFVANCSIAGGWFYFGHIPSTMNERDFVDLARTSLTFFWSAELFQDCAFSGLSKAMMIMRFGGVPSSAVILSVRVR